VKSFQVRSEKRGPQDQHEVVVLQSADGSHVAEVCPGLGFNCYRWAVDGEDFLYTDPQFFAGGSPTRSGIPILFPFPNRIRDGRFRWDGKSYQLLLNDPAKKNAIHGFTPRRPWRLVDRGADDAAAWVTAEFQGAKDAADCVHLWPTDYRIRVTYRLSAGRLRTEAVVDNPDHSPLPFGLGYHHYFLIGSGETSITASAAAGWQLVDNLPTGKKLPPEASWDLNRPRRFEELDLDDVLTGLPDQAESDGLCPRGLVRRAPGGRAVRLRASPAFRELVAYTPPHRQAICLEPYTCTTDAMNLQQSGVDAGWLVLPAGERWQGIVEVALD
jgi:aldose 1-epimerase